jgi:hypothetical protein
MSDFLSDLVERSFGATGTVRPQLASIFETTPPVNGGAFFRTPENPELPAIEQQNQEPADRISRLQSLWKTTSAKPATPFAAGLSQAGVTSPESAELPGASRQVRLRIDPAGKPQSVARSSEPRGTAGTDKTEEGAAALQPELPGASRQVRPRVDLPEKQQSIVPARKHRETADAATTEEEGAGALQPELPSASPQIRPRLDLPRKDQSVARSSEPRGTGGKDKTNEEDAGALRPQLPPDHRTSTSGGSKPEPPGPTENRPHEGRAEKTIELIAPERYAHRELTRARDVRAVSQRSPSPRPPAVAPQPKNPPVAPSINVTIGRVEVRATLPPAPSKTSRASAPILNLDEYLRQRAAGRR